MLKRNQLIIEAKMLPSPGNELHLTALAQGSYLQQGLPFYSTVRQVTDWAVVEELQQEIRITIFQEQNQMNYLKKRLESKKKKKQES